MTRYFLVSAMLVGMVNAAFAIVPPIPPVVVIPNVPDAKADGEEADDVAKLADRIGKNAKTVTGKLGEQDTGDDTRRDQKKLKQDLDKLIDLLQNPPPPPMSNDSSQQPPPPMGGGGGSGNQKPPPPMGGQPPKGGSQRTGSGRQQKPPMPMGGMNEPMPMPMGNKGGMGEQQPMPMPSKPDNNGQPMSAKPMGEKGGNDAGKGGQATPTLPLAETIAKDFWGHLPEVPRQRMMQFFKEQYNSRYKDLLPDYFSTLAEKEKKGKK